MDPIRRGLSLSVSLVLVAAPGLLAEPPRPIALEVDAREAPKKVFHAHLTIPAAPGPLTLVYPEWIPGEHGPAGPIADLAGLRISADGREVPWSRGSEDMFAFHLEVPAGAASIEVAFDYLSPGRDDGKFSSAASATANLAVISWNTLALAPQGKSSDELMYAASVRLPAGWRYGTALPLSRETPERVEFAPVSFTTLVDAPLLTGAHFRTVTLTTEAPVHRIHIAADGDAALEASPALIDGWKRLVAETGALFGARHYRSYSFLLTLSDHTAHFGLEHHESSDNRVPERSLIDDDRRRVSAGLLPHEITHSWNGKYRRPAGLSPGSFEKPMRGDLLWVYEGLTEYLGDVLTARSGLWTSEEYREELALTAATMDRQAGRAWRSLADTAVSAQILYDARPDWAAARRGVDFYSESELLWLQADAIIRQESHGAKSLDDFCRLFLGGESGPPSVVTYGFDDVVEALGKVAPYDWRGFWRSHLDRTSEHAPLDGVSASGWKVVYTDRIPQMQKSAEEQDDVVDVRFSLGFQVQKSGVIPDVLPGSPADRAGVGPGVTLVAANGRRFSRETLRDAIRETKALSRPIELLVENGGFFRTHRLEYSGGESYPSLAPEEGKADLLSEILKPRSARPAAPGAGR